MPIYCRLLPWLAIVMALMSAWTGCSSVPLPAIDPTGERIFLPSPSYTTVVGPSQPGQGFCVFPEPAFTEPAPIPPCPAGVPAAPTGTGVAVADDRLILTPARIVAPINSEVVLLAGLCGRDGFYVTKQPVEWMLSPDSVGNIIGLADSAHPHLAKISHHQGRKECNNLAITRTSTTPQLVTRGTPLPNDDVLVAKGQTWISVSSPTEGVSYVTALAKRADNWETRRQTATIHWVDMQWAFPSPQIVRAGEAALLQTAVTKTSTGNPAAQVIVRYEVVGGVSASFGGTGRTAVEVPTDETGRANVQLVQETPGPGTTQVRIQILSPSIQGDVGSRAAIGEGFTNITWSAPGLLVRTAGPAFVSRGGVASYRIEVSNPGDLPTGGVVLRVDLPPALRFLNSDPVGQVYTNRLEWNLGDLSAGQSVLIQLNCQAANTGEFQLVARAASPNAPEARSAVETRVVESGLSVRFVNPPTTGIVGGRVDYNFEVTNTGSLPLENVVVQDAFDTGLRPAYEVDPRAPLTLELGTLQPGETQQRGITFIIQSPGQLCHRLSVTASGGHNAAAETCITATQPTLSLDVRKIGPEQARVGESVRFEITVTNTGNGVLTNVQIIDRVDQNLEPLRATVGGQRVDGAIVWQVGNLGPGQNAVREIECVCRNAAPTAQNQVEVVADGGLREVAAAQLAIAAAAAAAPPAPAETPTTPITPSVPTTPQPVTSGQRGLELKVADLGDPAVGGKAMVLIWIRNLSNEADQDLQLTVQLPPEFTDVNISQQSFQAPVTPVAGGVAIGPIREVRGNETLPSIRLNATAIKAGRYQVKVLLQSRRLTQPLEATEEINVIPQ